MTRNGKGRRSGDAALARYCADRLSLWCLCGQRACVRARSCRGDVENCSGRLVTWLAAMQRQERAAPTFADMEALIDSPEEMRAYRGWRALLARVEAGAKTPPAETAMLRAQLRRQVEALARQMKSDRQP